MQQQACIHPLYRTALLGTHNHTCSTCSKQHSPITSHMCHCLCANHRLACCRNTTQQLLSQKALLGGCAFTVSLLSDYACIGWHQSVQSNSTACIRISITAPEQHPAYVAAAPTAFQADQSSCSTAKGDTSCAHTHCEVQMRPSDATTATGAGGAYPKATAYAVEKLYQCCQYIPGGFSLCYSTVSLQL